MLQLSEHSLLAFVSPKLKYNSPSFFFLERQIYDHLLTALKKSEKFLTTRRICFHIFWEKNQTVITFKMIQPWWLSRLACLQIQVDDH